MQSSRISELEFGLIPVRVMNIDKKKAHLLCLCLLPLIILIASCQSAVRFASADASKEIKPVITKSAENPLIATAESFIGTPYCFGGRDNNCMDCSGFVQEVYRQAGFILPRTAHQQFTEACILINQPKPGDLVFFRNPGSSRITHVALYAGDNLIIHASESRGIIKEHLSKLTQQIGLAGFGQVARKQAESQ